MYVPTDGHFSFQTPSNVTRSTQSKVDTQKNLPKGDMQLFLGNHL